VLTTRGGVRVAVFPSEAELDRWWLGLKKQRGRILTRVRRGAPPGSELPPNRLDNLPKDEHRLMLRSGRLHDLPDLLSHGQSLGGCFDAPCDFEESQSRLDLGDADASLGDNLSYGPLPLVVGGLDVADVVGRDRNTLFRQRIDTSWFLALWFALRYSRTAWDLFTSFFLAIMVLPIVCGIW